MSDMTKEERIAEAKKLLRAARAAGNPNSLKPKLSLFGRK